MRTQREVRTLDGTQHSAGQPPPVRRGLVFMIVAFALMMMSIDSTIVATALHALQHDLNTSVNWAGWTITAYSFGFVLMLPVSGRLSAQYGRRRVFLGSVLTFTAASLLAGLPTISTCLSLCAPYRQPAAQASLLRRPESSSITSAASVTVRSASSAAFFRSAR